MRIAGPALLLLGTIAAAQDGATAPANRWYTRGGCASRSATSASFAPRRDPVAAWSVPVRGTIESEPLVWDGVVILSAREMPGRRTLHVIDLESGRSLVRQPLPATVPLAPSIWGNRIAVRPAPDRVDIYRLSGNRLRCVRTIQGEAPFSEPLLFEDELYLRQAGELYRYDLDRREPRWCIRSTGAFRGSPTLHGDRIFAAWYDPENLAHLAAIQRSDGKIADDVVVGHHEGESPAADAEFAPVALAGEVFLTLPLPVPSRAGEEFGAVCVYRDGEGFSRSRAPTLHGFRFDPVPFAGGWTAFEERGDGAPRWMSMRSQGDRLLGIVLADGKHHARLLEEAVAPSRAGDVLFLNDLAVEPEEFRIRWRAPHPPIGRPVPIDGGLLVIRRPDTLTLLRPPPLPRTPAETRAEEAVAKMDADLAEGYAALAWQAVRAGDPDLVARLIEEACERGAKGRSLDTAQDGLARLLESSSLRQPRKVTTIEVAERALLEREHAELLRRAGDAGTGAFSCRVLRALHERDPESEAVAAMVRSLIPEEAPRSREIDVASWLDFLEAQAATPVHFIAPPPEGKGGEGFEERALAREIAGWRGDVSGYRTGNLLIVTPPGRPGAVAAALGIGELVCRVLEEMVGEDGATGERPRDPMMLLLYESKESYVTQSQRQRSAPEIARGWTAGHFDPAEGVSRMFVPEAGEKYANLLEVYAHELTHHWLDARAPFASTLPAASQPGFWIAEGFPVMLSEFHLDPERGSWDPRNPRASSLDVVANATPEQLIPWSRLFSLSQEEFTRLSLRPDRTVPRTWQLGVTADKCEIEFFYAQAGAACHFLFRGENETHRAELLQYLRDWYEQRESALDPAGAFGLRAETLGDRVTAFARATSGG
jgi:hypothetical protein